MPARLIATRVRLPVAPEFTPVPSGTNFRLPSLWCRKRDSNPRPHHYEARNRGISGVHHCSLRYTKMRCRTATDRRPGRSRLRTPLNVHERQRTAVEHGNCNRDVTAANLGYGPDAITAPPFSRAVPRQQTTSADILTEIARLPMSDAVRHVPPRALSVRRRSTTKLSDDLDL